MPRSARGRTGWIKSEKGEYNNYSTIGEIAALVGRSDFTIERWIKQKKIPKPSVRSPNGWRLWHPDDVKQIIQDKQRGRI